MVFLSISKLIDLLILHTETNNNTITTILVVAQLTVVTTIMPSVIVMALPYMVIINVAS